MCFLENFAKIFKNTFFTEQLREAASGMVKLSECTHLCAVGNMSFHYVVVWCDLSLSWRRPLLYRNQSNGPEINRLASIW